MIQWNKTKLGYMSADGRFSVMNVGPGKWSLWDRSTTNWHTYVTTLKAAKEIAESRQHKS